MGEQSSYCLWICWEEHIASFHAVEGYECLPCCTAANYQENIRLLIQSGFRILDDT